jgi:hypothetical protein
MKPTRWSSIANFIEGLLATPIALPKMSAANFKINIHHHMNRKIKTHTMSE